MILFKYNSTLDGISLSLDIIIVELNFKKAIVIVATII